MSLFGKLSDIFTRRSPRRPVLSPQNTPHPVPPSDATSDHIQRTETSGAWNAGSPLESHSLHTSFEGTFPSTSASSNAEGLRHNCELRPVRPQYRQTVPRSESGMRRLTGETTHAKLRRTPESKDEARLFFSSKRKDPAGVPVVPGQARNNKPKSPYAPVDRISKARDSGPVRAQGKQRHSRDDQAENAAGYPRSERPSKRRRQGSLEGYLREKPRNFPDNDVAEHPAQEAHRIADHPSRMSPTLSQNAGKTKKQRNNRRGEVKEYRSVEKYIKLPRIQPSPKRGAPKPYAGASSDDDRDERFTENATKERRRISSLLSEMDSGHKPERPLKPEVLESVEIINPRSPVLAMDAKWSPTLPQKSFKTDIGRNITESRESPDELQGAVTVRPPTLSEGARAELERHIATTGRQPSSQDIQPTIFESSQSKNRGKRKNKRAQPSETISTQQSFGAAFVRFGPTEHHASSLCQPLEIDVDKVKHMIALARAADLVDGFEVPLSKVISIVRGDSTSNKVRLNLNLPAVGRLIDIDFVSMPEKEGFCSLLSSVTSIQERPSEWMNKAFNKAQREHKQFPNGTKRPCSESGPEHVPDKPAPSTKRVKLTDALRDKNGVAVGRQPSTSERANPSTEPSQPEKSPARVSKRAAEPSVEIPVKKFAPSMSTRAMSRRPTSDPTTVVCDDSDDSDDDLAEQPVPEVHAKKWHKPLVYPLIGKKKAEVDVYDLERLRENEFLNDNLIGFYIRFLQEHLDRTNKEVAKKVYFFNSFFHDTLMKVPRGKRGINYEGVQKWTRTVDIFSHDYVVVPINESAHWYVAIICNLPSLQGIAEESPTPGELTEGEKEPSAPPDSQVREIFETPEPETTSHKDDEDGKAIDSEFAREELARQSLASMRLFDESAKEKSNEGSGVDEEWPEVEENPISPPKGLSTERLDAKTASQLPEPSAKPRKQKIKRGPKYDAFQPIILTFDSLNVSRSPTISSLREYLCKEAKSKKGIDINKNLIKGMRAQDIPLQPNYSDCGLYLLAYLEKFVQDPDVFVRKILRREMDQVNDWPPLRSGLLRHRLRKFLDALWDEQEQLKSQKMSDHETMADKKPICYLLGGPTSANVKYEQESSGAMKLSENFVPDSNHERHMVTGVEVDLNRENPTQTELVGEMTGSQPHTAGTLKQSAERDVVLVPDSQPEIASSNANPQPSKSPRRAPETDLQPRIVIDIKDVAEGEGPDTVTVVPVETQVRETPPRSSAPVRGSVEKSPT
ncbi:Ulp1 protease [Aspergillus sclerotioniger CBS 115572]|uniref:Ulp1 protease n=1 Tax=Aspergillus sclerotioniger CBS 115572 TaxID=1450535 RepID=A0A317WJ26_9EURO|nr:Ulp1 protease [Aspergillus sclerotioniger CBS 115572]PWY86456.1 Ulp1 protease [Aspergillus sclerotioniger CBS 115572]